MPKSVIGQTPDLEFSFNAGATYGLLQVPLNNIVPNNRLGCDRIDPVTGRSFDLLSGAVNAKDLRKIQWRWNEENLRKSEGGFR